VSSSTSSASPPEDSPTTHRVVRLRCESCSTIISTRHAWDHVTCACGALSASGRPWRPTIHWLATSGGGWTDLDDGVATTDPSPAGDGDGDGDGDGPRRPIGF
jgi:hypothetical protein